MDIGIYLGAMWVFVIQLNAARTPTKSPLYSTELETALRTELFNQNNYEVLQRPSKTVLVTVSLTILTVNYLNIKDQTLSISGYLHLTWNDSRLNWYNSTSASKDYSNIPFLFSTETFVWRPALVIENSVDDMSVISAPNIPMRIVQSGTIYWNPSGIYKVSCESDTSYYPLDRQECSIKLSAWAYTSGQLVLEFGQNKPVDLSYYTENGEWELIKANKSYSGTNTKDGVLFSSLTFSITLQRRPMFHIIKTIIPVVLMAFLTAMVFKLPVESGEKIGFSLTVLLAYAVYLTLISAEIPSTSITVCYLSMYLVFILTLGVISVCLTIFVLSLHHWPKDKEVQRWLIRLTALVLVRIACTSAKCCRRCTNRVDSTANVAPNSREKLYSTENEATMDTLNIGETLSSTDNEATTDTRNREDEHLTWQRLAKIMDKVFFNVYIVLIIVVTIILVCIITSEARTQTKFM